MPNQVDGVLLHTMSGSELSRVRTEFKTRNSHSPLSTPSPAPSLLAPVPPLYPSSDSLPLLLQRKELSPPSAPPRLLLPSLSTKVYSGRGADIVMQSSGFQYPHVR